MVENDKGKGREVHIWDLPIRIFHWFLVVVVVLGWATGEGGGAVFVVHGIAGYALLAALLFRLVWGAAGSRHARFADFVKPWREVGDYAIRLMKLSPPRYVGHNPLGGWMVLLFLAVLFLLVVTGLFAAGEDGSGSLAEELPRWIARASAEIHQGLFEFLLFLIAVHVAGVLLHSPLTGENLIRAMWTGRKRLAEKQARAEEPPVPALWAVPVVAVATAMVWLALA